MRSLSRGRSSPEARDIEEAAHSDLRDFITVVVTPVNTVIMLPSLKAKWYQARRQPRAPVLPRHLVLAGHDTRPCDVPLALHPPDAVVAELGGPEVEMRLFCGRLTSALAACWTRRRRRDSPRRGRGEKGGGGSSVGLAGAGILNEYDDEIVMALRNASADASPLLLDDRDGHSERDGARGRGTTDTQDEGVPIIDHAQAAGCGGGDGDQPQPRKSSTGPSTLRSAELELQNSMLREQVKALQRELTLRTARPIHVDKAAQTDPTEQPLEAAAILSSTVPGDRNIAGTLMAIEATVEDPVEQEVPPVESLPWLRPPPLVIPPAPYFEIQTPEAAVAAVGSFCATPETAPRVQTAGVRSVLQRAPPGLPEPDVYLLELQFAYLRAQAGLLASPPRLALPMEALRAPPGLPPPSGLLVRPPPGFRPSDRLASSTNTTGNEPAPTLRPPPGLSPPRGLAVHPPPGFQSCDRSAPSTHVADHGPAPTLRPPPGLAPPPGLEQPHRRTASPRPPLPPPPPATPAFRVAAGPPQTPTGQPLVVASPAPAPPVVRVAAGPPQAPQQAGSLSLEEIWADGKQRGILTEWTARHHELSTPVPMYEKLLGQGTFGTVYLVVDKGNKVVAVKKTPCGPYDLAQKAVQYCEAAVNEADLHEKATAKGCPYVIGFLGACISHYSLWVKMEVAPAGDLVQFCGQTPFTGHVRDAESLVYIGACLVLTVNQLALIGIYHRDIKPNNMLLDAKGRLKLADFNLATTDLHNNTEYAGTWEFMAPEIKPFGTTASSPPYGWKADLWSAAVTVEYLCKGTPEPGVQQMIDILKKVDPNDRPGLEAFTQLPCFATYDWDAMVSGTAEPPTVLEHIAEFRINRNTAPQP